MEIAELELRVKGSGIEVARGQLRTISEEASHASQNFRSIGTSAQLLTTSLRNIQGSRTFLDLISQQSQMDKQLAAEFQMVGTQMRLLGPGFLGITEGATKATAAKIQLTAANDSLKISMRSVSTPLVIVGSQIGGLGPVAGIAANAITTMTLASGPAGLALAALAASTGFLMHRIEQARERFRELSERELAGLARTTEELKFGQDIREQIKLLEAAQDPLEQVRLKTEQVVLAAEKSGEKQKGLRFQELSIEIEKLKIGSTALSEGFQLLGVSTRLSQADLKTFALQAAELQRGFDRGKVSAEQFETAIRNLAKQATLGGGKPTLKDVPTGSAIIGGKTFDFSEQRLIGNEANEIKKELFSIRDAIVELSKSPRELVNEFSLQPIAERFAKVGEIIRQRWGVDAPQDIAQLQTSLSSLLGTLASTFKLQIEIEGEIVKIKNVGAELDALRAKATTPIIQEVIVRTTAAGSPTLPFSEYFKDYAPGVLKDFTTKARDMAVNLNTDFSQGITASLSRMAELEAQISGFRASREGGFQASILGDFSARPRAELEALQRNVAFMLSLSRPSPPEGAGGGGGGGVVVNISFNGPVTQEVLDKGFFPKFEKTLERTTGTKPKTQVLN